jgi:uncharacterized membrane protein
MNVLAWILSALLAFAFVFVGANKALKPRDKLLEDPRMAWANDFNTSQVKAIGTLEVLGGIALILPWLIDVAPVLTPIAALGLALLMAGGLVTHARRGELQQALPVNATLLVLAAVVAAIRFSQL